MKLLRKQRKERTWARYVNQRKSLWSLCSLERRLMLAGDAGREILIRAAGAEGDEQMQLLIDNQVVQTFSNVGGNADLGQFRDFTYTAASPVTPDQIRVALTNDVYQPQIGLDRNLRVDYIQIDATRYQTEAPTTFSTGTWKASDGIVPGFRESEWMHTNGYFEYSTPNTSGSTITIFAAGYENTENMELRIGGQTVQTWTNIGGDVDARRFAAFNYFAAANVDVSDVQITFTNDQYVPGTIDRNLVVDRIEIDGVTYQTEAPNVYSEGNWQNGSIAPGFRQSETLHTNGFFHYGQNPSDAGIIRLASSNIIVNENSGTASVVVNREQGTRGTVTVDYETFDGTATSGADYTRRQGTITFASGQSSAVIQIPIANDTAVEPTETLSVAIDNVRGGATLLVPRTATVSILDDDVALPNYPNFSSVNSLTLNGGAAQVSNFVELTPNVTGRAGSMFFNQALSLTDNSSFRTQFSFVATGGNSGADGLTFTIQNDPRGTAAIGAPAGNLGFEGITQAVAVEFDTYRNLTNDINNNHIAILGGSISTPLKSAIPDFDINSGTPVNVWVDYNGTSKVLAVYASTSTTRPTIATLKATIDLQATVGNSAYFGFTAATGGASNAHRIHSWTLDRTTPPADPPTELGDQVVSVDVVTGLQQPTAITWMPNGNALVALKSGVVRVIDSSNRLVTQPFIDISGIVNDTRDRGLLDVAVHPDFVNNPYVYLLYTYDPPEVNNQSSGSLAGPDGNGNRAGRLMRVTADAATGYRTIVAGSQTVILGTNSTWQNFDGFANSTVDFTEPPAGENPDGTYVRDFIPSDSESHTVGSLAFGIDGSLFVSIGDGASYNRVDIRADRVQDIDSLSGKILRIDPITGRGLSDNPFYNGDLDANRSKVYQSGLRNPFRISVDDATGRLFIGDVGWTKWEEINTGAAGANFGWPFYEGGNGQSLINSSYANTPEGIAFFARNVQVTAPFLGLNHQSDGINAIVLGDVYRGSAYGPAYQGDVFFNDLGQGIVRHASINPDGTLGQIATFATGANIVVAMRQGPDGLLYFVDLDDGKIGRWELV
jgi:glucose/arabinose dehydrogenase